MPLQRFIDNTFYYLFIFTLIFGVIFYDALGFNFTDELCALFLCGLYAYYVFHTKNWSFNKLFLITIFVFLFYLVYSLLIKSNTKGAIISDFIIQLKPYIAFFTVYAFAPVLNKQMKKNLSLLSIICSVYLLIIAISYFFTNDLLKVLLFHPSRLATATIITALLYLYCNEYTLKNKLIFLLILAIGLISGRSKMYGFFVICTFFVFFINNNYRFKFNIKTIAVLCMLVAAVVFVSWNKIHFYFIQGGFGDDRETQDLYARMALYFFSLQIFKDYFPFGSGFASFGTYSSGQHYSHIYDDYNMNTMHGLTKSDPKFIADTYYPALAQFGVVGLLLFFAFWVYLGLKALKGLNNKINYPLSVTAILIIIFFLVECTSDSTITHNRGLFMMMLLALSLSDLKRNLQEESVHESSNS